jgi:uncharacterized protein YprB with RNaseH-like and TPR domain
MSGLRESKNHIKTTVTLAISVHNGTVIDFETTGIPGKDKDHEAITLGYLHGSELVIIQRKTKEKALFYEELREMLQGLPRPFYAYNAKFERSMMEVELGVRVDDQAFVDLMHPWSQKADQHGLKWPKLDELMSEPGGYFKENKVSGKDIPGLWKAYIDTGDESKLQTIMQHCLSDVLRAAILLIRYQP